MYNSNKLEILFQDQWIAVVNKPAGMLSVPYGGSKGKTAQSVLEDLLRKQGKVNSKHKPFPVHRLDRDTSGVMMFALTELSQKKIMDNWHKMVKERLYIAMAENPSNKNLILPDSGLIDMPLATNAHHIGYVPKPGKSFSGKEVETVPGRTNYRIIQRGQTHTLFQLSLDTGKKNQIRAHLAACGYALSGDFEHRGHQNPFNRLCLHARTLKFEHPFTKEIMNFEVKEPEEWINYVKKTTGRQQFTSGKTGSKSVKLSDKDKRLSKKQTAHMNFIQQGCLKSKKR